MSEIIKVGTQLQKIIDAAVLIETTARTQEDLILRGLIDQINALLASDDVSLDELQELVDYIKANRGDIDSLGIAGVAGLQAVLDTEQAARLAGDASDYSKVVFEGDSITAGTPQPGPQGQANYGQYAPTWADQIQGLSAFDSNTLYTKTAVSGSFLATMQARYTSQVLPNAPANGATQKVLLIGMIGINDIAANQLNEANADTWFASLEAYWNQAKSDGFYLVWISPTMGTSNAPAMRIIREKILKSSIPDQVIDANSFFENTPASGMYESDRLHLTDIGGKRYAERVNAYLLTGQSNATPAIYKHGNIIYFDNSDNAILPNGEIRAAYILRFSASDYSQKNSGLIFVSSASHQGALASSNGSLLNVAPSGKNIQFGVAPTSSDIQTIRWGIAANGVWKGSRYDTPTDTTQQGSFHFGFVPVSGQVFTGSSANQFGMVLPSGLDFWLATQETGTIQDKSFGVRNNGDIVAPKVRTFADDAAADSDATLISGSFYKLTGSRAIYQKP